MKYMTNVPVFEGIEDAVTLAAMIARVRVNYHPHPIPYSESHNSAMLASWYPAYHKEMGSISTTEPPHVDLTLFWFHYHRLKSYAERES